MNTECTREKKSIRGIEIFKFIYELLKDGIDLTQNDYQYYYDHLLNEADTRRITLQTEINSKEGALKATKRRSKNIGLKIIDYSKDSPVWKVNNEQLIKLEAEEKDLKKQIIELQEQQTDPQQDVLSVSSF